MRRAIVFVVSLFFVSTALADSVGVFTVVEGDVTILRDQNYLAAAQGVDVAPDDIIETGKNASAQLDLEDGSVLKLGPDTRVVLSDYKLDSNKNVASAALDVLTGWVRFAVAKLKPEGRYNIHTPVLTIGVRGTEGTIQAQNEEGGLHLSEGAVDVSPVGDDARGVQPARINGGEYIERVRGRNFVRLAQPPRGFNDRLPTMLRAKLARRAHMLKQHGVPPRVIRKMTREDAKRFMKRHPNMNQQLRRRFGADGANAAGTRQFPAGKREEILRRRQHQQESNANPNVANSHLNRGGTGIEPSPQQRRFQKRQAEKEQEEVDDTKPTQRPRFPVNTLQRPVQ